jgi:hypothetical protein
MTSCGIGGNHLPARSVRCRVKKHCHSRHAWALALAAVMVFAVVAPPPHAAGAATAPRRCPAPGETIDDAISTVPPRHTPEELAAIRQAIEPKAPWPKNSPIMSIGDGRDTVEIWLVPGREDIAAQLVQQYGEAVRIHVGATLYVPHGCGSPPTPPHCPDLTGDAPSSADLRLSLVVDHPRLQPSRPGGASLEVRNLGTKPFTIEPGSVLVGSLVKPGTTHVVGVNTFPVAGTGKLFTAAPGATVTIPVVFGAGRCDGRAGSALPPGRYGLRVVLTPEGPPSANLTPRLLSPQTLVTVTR